MTLPQRQISWRDSGNLLPADPEARFAFGANARLQYLNVFSDDTEDTSSFEVSDANVYAEGRLLPGRLSVYLDLETGAGASTAREVFALLSFAKWRGYLKVGKLLPPFGWRLPDDNAFIRRFSGFSYDNPDVGIEVGAEPGRWSMHLAAVNGSGGGSDEDRSKQFSLLTVKRFDQGRLGLSASNNIGGGARTTQAGLLGGASFGRLTMLAEGDWRETRGIEGTRKQLLGLLEADLLVLRGLNIKFAHDWIDPDRDLDTDNRVRDSIGVEYIPIPFLQLRAFVRRFDGPSKVLGARDEQVDLELHVFF